MRRRYSFKSLSFSKFPICYETLSKSVRFSSVEIRKGYSNEVVDAEHLEVLKDLSNEDLPIEFRFLREESHVSIRFHAPWTILIIDMYGFEEKKSKELYQIIQEKLGLTDPTEEDERGVASIPNINDLVWKVYDRVEQISKRIDTIESKSLGNIRCFVSFRFDEHSKALAFELREFMNLVGVEFVSGLGYEPRSLSEKVLERLSEPLNLFFVLFSSSGDSAWLNQEVGVARARNLPILVLKEETSDVDLGMLGDAEYLLFPKDNISKAFVGILQALSYVKKLDKS